MYMCEDEIVQFKINIYLSIFATESSWEPVITLDTKCSAQEDISKRSAAALRYLPQQHSDIYGIPVRTCELRAASCVLRPASLALVPCTWAASCELRPATCELRPAPCVLRPATCEMMNCEKRHASWDLRPAYCGSSDLVIQTAWVYNLCASYKGTPQTPELIVRGADLLCLVWDNISVPSLTGHRKTWQGDPRP